jgi:hypothetical protein
MALTTQVELDMIAGCARGWANNEQTCFVTLQEEPSAQSPRVDKK